MERELRMNTPGRINLSMRGSQYTHRPQMMIQTRLFCLWNLVDGLDRRGMEREVEMHQVFAVLVFFCAKS
jgi:hypothetical protein